MWGYELCNNNKLDKDLYYKICKSTFLSKQIRLGNNNG